MPLKSIDVTITIKGFVAHVTSHLTYINVESQPIEAVYEFPVDEQSAIYHFEATIEDRTIVAECQEKEQVSYSDDFRFFYCTHRYDDTHRNGPNFDITLV